MLLSFTSHYFRDLLFCYDAQQNTIGVVFSDTRLTFPYAQRTVRPVNVGHSQGGIGMLGRLHSYPLAAAACVLMLLAPSAAAQARSDAGLGVIVAERHGMDNGGGGQIIMIRPGHSGVRVLTVGNEDEQPDRSPDGRTIVFQRCVGAVNCDDIGKFNIWIMRADGSGAHALTSCVPGSDCLGSFGPAFSPDGRLIAFSRDQLDGDGVNFNGIFTMRADGTHLRRVTSTGANAGPDSNPRFSPDGRQVIFDREDSSGTTHLMLARTDGSDVRALLPSAEAFAPDWAPDGRHVSFSLIQTSGDTSTLDVATVRLGDSHIQLVTHEPAGSRAFQPDYSPDGRELAFIEANDDGCGPIISRTDGGSRHPLDSGNGCTINPSWGR
jgi:Tol biopolymer transport system component